MTIRVREAGSITVLDVEGRVDINASEFIEVVGRVLKNNKTKILCNFENVELVDYSGLSILAIAYKNVVNHNGIMKFYKVGLHVKELFRIVHMDKLFYCHDNEEEALKYFDDKTLDSCNRPLRRRFKRLEINITAAFKPAQVTGKEVQEYSGKVLNISGAGLFIYASHLFPVRTQLKLEISLPNELVPLEMDGMVIWMADKSLQSDCYPGMGVQFIDVDSEKQKELLEFIDKNITHRSER
ncbi:MAG: PilZ domain-containing protein [Candidatus Omnitrophica bacterium]|nr:PilZ domain-containing protein [Candidatus Omnitrophota bacterium]